jgi:hypothetical protein
MPGLEDALGVTRKEMARRGWKPADLVAACSGSPSRATIYQFLAGQPVSRRCQALILRAVGRATTDPPDGLAPLGTQIRRRREDLGMTIRELASATDIHPDYLRHIERGRVVRVPADIRVRMSRHLQCKPAQLDPSLV